MRAPPLRAAFAAFCLLTAVYWLCVTNAGSPIGGQGFRMLLAVMAGASLLAVLVALRPSRHGLTFSTAVGSLALFLSLQLPWAEGLGVSGPSQPQWLTAIAALAYAVTSAHPLRRTAVLGIGTGALALAATAIAMFPDPTIFARVIGCVE